MTKRERECVVENSDTKAPKRSYTTSMLGFGVGETTWLNGPDVERIPTFAHIAIRLQDNMRGKFLELVNENGWMDEELTAAVEKKLRELEIYCNIKNGGEVLSNYLHLADAFEFCGDLDDSTVPDYVFDGDIDDYDSDDYDSAEETDFLEKYEHAQQPHVEGYTELL